VNIATPENEEPPVIRRAPRWMWIVLVVSLALNLIVIGMAAATIFHFRKHHVGPTARFGQYVRTLPSERRDTLRALLDQRQAAVRPLRREARAARRRARRAFAAQPFDRDKLFEAYRSASDARIALIKARGDWFAKFATELSANERRDYLQWRSRHRKFWRRRRWRPE
jgi:uncharacterized membrane protein